MFLKNQPFGILPHVSPGTEFRKQAVIYCRIWLQVKKLAAVAAVANGDIIGHRAEPAAS